MPLNAESFFPEACFVCLDVLLASCRIRTLLDNACVTEFPGLRAAAANFLARFTQLWGWLDCWCGFCCVGDCVSHREILECFSNVSVLGEYVVSRGEREYVREGETLQITKI